MPLSCQDLQRQAKGALEPLSESVLQHTSEFRFSFVSSCLFDFTK